MTAPNPPRPLGTEGTKVWNAWCRRVDDRDRLLALCEAVDERLFLRTKVLRGEVVPAERDGLRKLDREIEAALTAVRKDAQWRAYARRR
jgi:hypothetical protein